MKTRIFLMIAAFTAPLHAQNVTQVEDTPEEIAKDAARDLKDNRFYNKPGATRAEYDRDWQECRLIARGSRTPSGTTSFYNPALYNPAISPLAGAVGGGIGAAIGAAIIQGQQRRANRKSCLMIRGWRLVELPADETVRISALSDADKNSYFDRIIGAANIDGSISSISSFARNFETPVPSIGTVQFFAGKKVDPKAPVNIGEEEAAVVVAFRRSVDMGNQHGIISLRRFDAVKGDLIFQPRDWKKKGDKTVYSADVVSADKKAAYEIHMMRLTPGSYAIDFDGLGKLNYGTTNCFGAPMFSLKAGEVAYLTDIVPVNMKKADGRHVFEVGLVRDFSGVRSGFAQFQPALAERMTEATIKNKATYSCFGINMTRMDFPGISEFWTASSEIKSEGNATTAASIPTAAVEVSNRGN
jgi:hypothetical protein